jgi:hypothetical protein
VVNTCIKKIYIIKEMTLEIVMILSGAIGAIGALCYSIRRSRCSTIETPCFKITREVMTAEEMKVDTIK